MFNTIGVGDTSDVSGPFGTLPEKEKEENAERRRCSLT